MGLALKNGHTRPGNAPAAHQDDYAQGCDGQTGRFGDGGGAKLGGLERYPPVGHRSIGGTMPQLGFAQMPPGESTKIVNDNLLVVVMLESPLAIKNAEAIAAVKGIDVLLVGTSDLTLEMGLPGQLMHAEVVKAYQTVVDACKKHKKWAGMGGVYTDEGLTKYIGMGVKMVLAGNDMPFLMQAATAREKHLRAVQK